MRSDSNRFQLCHAAVPAGGGALFVDRDGILIADTGYVRDPDHVVLVDGSAALVALANRANVPVIVVTNQSGIGRGLLTWDDFDRVNERMQALLAEAAGARLDAVLACSDCSKIMEPRHSGDSGWRKPRPGMLLAARDRLGVNLAASWLVGDRWSDMRAAKRAGLAGAFLLRPVSAQPSQLRRNGFCLRTGRRLDQASPLPALIAREAA